MFLVSLFKNSRCALADLLVLSQQCLYVTGFGKMCIVHTSNIAHLAIHKNYREWYTDGKLSRIIKEK